MTPTVLGRTDLGAVHFTHRALAQMVGQRPPLLVNGNHQQVAARTTILDAIQRDDRLTIAFTIDEVSPDAALAEAAPPETFFAEAIRNGLVRSPYPLSLGFQAGVDERPDTTSPDDRPLDAAEVHAMWWQYLPSAQSRQES